MEGAAPVGERVLGAEPDGRAEGSAFQFRQPPATRRFDLAFGLAQWLGSEGHGGATKYR